MWFPSPPIGFPFNPERQKELVRKNDTEKNHTNAQKNHKTNKINKKTIKCTKSTNKNSNTYISNHNSILTIFSANAAGMARKSHSLTHELKECNANIFAIQETNYKKKGRYSNNEYEIFEAIRKKQGKRWNNARNTQIT